MQLQKTIVRNTKAEFVVDLVESVSGVLLVLFLWTHMIFVATILFGVDPFNALAKFLEDYYLLPAAVVFILLVFLAHIGSVLKRIPGRWREQKIVWNHAKTIKHGDTWSWLFQCVSGLAILILASIHIVLVVYGGIDAKLSADRVNSPILWIYLLLLFFGEYHASIGLYRIAVKWGWMKRQSIKKVLSFVTFALLALGLATLWVFYTLGGAA
ncbi:hypothetical protein L1765_05590 [Microaerobacter geothermalis]|uniref:hypothetical protein n=1 Tax=Microaerobacter geothermalis TaxID=674972 RepID=UPI001F4119C9|nr:hypothetical protein [Microaerobacter geothermalis]MCF6093458.1 hypothetical protein [Microaerobacter geothermalis]